MHQKHAWFVESNARDLFIGEMSHLAWFLMGLRLWLQTKLSLPNTPVSQSCAVAKRQISWRATGQSNLADRTWQTAPLAKMAFVWLRKPNFGSFCCSLLLCMLSLIVRWPARIFLSAIAHDCETGLCTSVTVLASWWNRGIFISVLGHLHMNRNIYILIDASVSVVTVYISC